jgi:hypothetical protein
MKTDDLIRALAADTAVTTGPLDKRAMVLGGIGLLAVAAIYLVMYPARYDLWTGGMAPTLMKLTFTAALVGAAAFALLKLAQPESWRMNAAAWLTLPAVVLLSLVAFDFAQRGTDNMYFRWLGYSALPCFTSIIVMSVVPLAAMLLALRNAAPASPARAGAFAGIVSAGLSATIYALHCINDSPLFMFWYVLATAVAAGAGALAGSRLLRW